MYSVKTLNKISKAGLAQFNKDLFTVADDIENADAYLVRSANLNDSEIPASINCIARAGAGVNNIPIDRCSEQGVVVFNTPGANANAVKELVIGTMILTSRNAFTSYDWAKTLKGNGEEVEKLVEKGKSQFVGPEVCGKTLGVIGLGAIGGLVANSAVSLGMNVIGYDPMMSVDAAWRLSASVHKATDLDQVFMNSDYITIHVPLLPDTKDTICKDSIAKMKDGVIILNFARGGLVNTADIIEAVESGKVAKYAADFINDDLLCRKNIIALPHLGASTPESEENCALMAVRQISDYMLYGKITNSVNFPNVDLTDLGGLTRICVLHKNIPNVISSISSLVAGKGINIDHLVSRSKKELAYAVLDVVTDPGDEIISSLMDIDGVIRVRIIR